MSRSPSSNASDEIPLRLAIAFRALRIVVAAVLVAYGIANLSQIYRETAWSVGGAVTMGVLSAAVLLVQRPNWVPSWAGIFGLFVVAQALLTPWLHDPDYLTLQPYTYRKIDVVGDGLRGIAGIQTITTDGRGYRVVSPPSDGKPPLKIVAIGGSTTEQIYLDDHATWTYLLQQRLGDGLGRPVEVINTGLSGLRAIHHLATLRHILPEKPAAAVFLLGINDWNHAVLRHFLYGDTRSGLRSFLVDANQTLKTIALEYSMGAQLAAGLIGGDMFLDRRALAEQRREQPPRIERGDYYRDRRNSLYRLPVRTYGIEGVDPIYADTLERISTLCHVRMLVCIFVTQPTGYSEIASEEFRRSFWMTPPDASYTLTLTEIKRLANTYNRFLADFARRHSHPLCDIAEALPPSFEYFYDDAHFNTAGARRVAALLAPCVNDALTAFAR